MLADKIAEAQAGNNDAMMELVNQFEALLKRYARKLHYEDALNDLTLDFIALIRKMEPEKMIHYNDGAVVSYIVTSVKNSYVKNVKRIAAIHRQEIGLSDLSEEQRYKLEGQYATDGMDELSEFLTNIPDGHLTKKERKILLWEYYLGMSSAEIAAKEGISRQSVNQTKQKALKKLRAAITGEGYHDQKDSGHGSGRTGSIRC